MDKATTIWRMLVASVAIWRLATRFFTNSGLDRRSQIPASQPENFLGDRILDGICWLSVWLSAQTALLVAGGLTALLLNWLALSILSRVPMPSPETDPCGRTDPRNRDLECLSVERAMQVNHV